MGVNSLRNLKTVTRQRRECDLNPGIGADYTGATGNFAPVSRKTGANVAFCPGRYLS